MEPNNTASGEKMVSGRGSDGIPRLQPVAQTTHDDGMDGQEEEPQMGVMFAMPPTPMPRGQTSLPAATMTMMPPTLMPRSHTSLPDVAMAMPPMPIARGQTMMPNTNMTMMPPTLMPRGQTTLPDATMTMMPPMLTPRSQTSMTPTPVLRAQTSLPDVTIAMPPTPMPRGQTILPDATMTMPPTSIRGGSQHQEGRADGQPPVLERDGYPNWMHMTIITSQKLQELRDGLTNSGLEIEQQRTQIAKLQGDLALALSERQLFWQCGVEWARQLNVSNSEIETLRGTARRLEVQVAEEKRRVLLALGGGVEQGGAVDIPALPAVGGINQPRVLPSQARAQAQARVQSDLRARVQTEVHAQVQNQVQQAQVQAQIQAQVQAQVQAQIQALFQALFQAQDQAQARNQAQEAQNQAQAQNDSEVPAQSQLGGGNMQIDLARPIEEADEEL